MFRVGFVYPGYENIGIECLSANLKKNGFDTRLFLDPVLFDENAFIEQPILAKVFSYKSVLRRQIQEYQPDLVCISVISDNYAWACDWAKDVKRLCGAKIIVGGIHPSSAPDDVIQNESIDYLCIGEGDEALVDLADALYKDADTTHIPSIWSVENQKVYRNDIRPLVLELDALPFPDKDLFYSNIPGYKRSYTIGTSRGCPQSCSFCCNNVWQSIYSDEKKRVRRRSVDSVIQELMEAKIKYQPEHVSFIDEIFNIEKRWIKHFAAEYKDKIGLPFSCFIFPDYMDEEMMGWLKEAGCTRAQMGVQIIDEFKRSEIMYRKSSNQKVAESIRLCKEAGIFTVCDIIFGFPETAKKDLRDIAEFFQKNTPDHIEVFWLRYYPKAAITKWAEEKGYISKGESSDIKKGKVTGGIFKSGVTDVYKLERQVMLFLYLLPFLSKSKAAGIIERKSYERFPSWVPLGFLYVMKRLLRRPKFDPNTEQTITRYWYCSRRIFGLKVKALFTSIFIASDQSPQPIITTEAVRTKTHRTQVTAALDQEQEKSVTSAN